MDYEHLCNSFVSVQSVEIRNLTKSPQVLIEVCTIDGELIKVDIPIKNVSKDIFISNSQLTFKF